MRLRPSLLAFGSAAWLALAACSTAATPSTPATPATPARANAPSATAAPADSATLEAQLREQIGDAPCSSDSQCHTLAWGTKACGGPERWVPWSSQNADAATVKSLGERYATARREDHLRTGGVSTCFMLADPGAHCTASHCQLGSAGGAPVSQ
jgi:hypothetical protein